MQILQDVSEPKIVEVNLKGASIATIEMGNKTMKLVIFKPTKATRQAVKTYVDLGIVLTIEDSNGRFSPKQAQVIVDSVYQDGTDTMIVTTEDQE